MHALLPPPTRKEQQKTTHFAGGALGGELAFPLALDAKGCGAIGPDQTSGLQTEDAVLL